MCSCCKYSDHSLLSSSNEQIQHHDRTNFTHIYIYTANDYREISVQSASPSSTLSRLIHAEKSITASIINKYSIRSQGPSSRLLRRQTVMLPFGLSG